MSAPAHQSNPRVASLRVSGRSTVALAPDVLDQLASTWDVSGTVAQEMFARLAGPDYRRWQAQAARCGFCAHPIRLHGRVVDGDGAIAFTTADKPDGVLLKRCGNRRRSVCPACSFLYAGDMWHLLFAGLAGRDIRPETISKAFDTLLKGGYSLEPVWIDVAPNAMTLREVK